MPCADRDRDDDRNHPGSPLPGPTPEHQKAGSWRCHSQSRRLRRSISCSISRHTLCGAALLENFEPRAACFFRLRRPGDGRSASRRSAAARCRASAISFARIRNVPAVRCVAGTGFFLQIVASSSAATRGVRCQRRGSSNSDLLAFRDGRQCVAQFVAGHGRLQSACQFGSRLYEVGIDPKKSAKPSSAPVSGPMPGSGSISSSADALVLHRSQPQQIKRPKIAREHVSPQRRERGKPPEPSSQSSSGPPLVKMNIDDQVVAEFHTSTQSISQEKDQCPPGSTKTFGTRIISRRVPQFAR